MRESSDKTTFKPLILVGKKCSAKDKVIEFLMNTYPGKFQESFLKDAGSFIEKKWTSNDSGKLLRQKIKIVDVELGQDMFSDSEANIIYTYPDENDGLISTMQNYIEGTYEKELQLFQKFRRY